MCERHDGVMVLTGGKTKERLEATTISGLKLHI